MVLLLKRRQTIAVVVTGVLALVLFVGVANAGSIKNQLNDWKLLPQPEHLTELYFTDHTKLPSTYSPGEMQTVAFTVHNLEYKTENYIYSIQQSSEDGTQKVALAKNVVYLKQDAYGRPSVPVTLSDLGKRSKVTVTLLLSGETISYWVNKA